MSAENILKYTMYLQLFKKNKKNGIYPTDIAQWSVFEKKHINYI